MSSSGPMGLAQVPLGRTPLQVTELGLGTAPLGGLYDALDEDTAAEAIQAALRAGIRFFDTAPEYGHGLAEVRLGRALTVVPRDEIVVATKVGRLLRKGVPLAKRYYHGTPDVNPVFDFSQDGVMRSVEESLERLGLDRVDILHIHDPDNHYDDAVNDAFFALKRLRDEGSIRAIGVGMNQAAMLARFARERDFDCFLLAGRYTLLEQGAIDDLLPLCEEKNIAIIAGSVYNSGLLAYPEPGTHYNYEPAAPGIIARAQQLAAVCAEHDVSLKAAAIQFPRFHPAVAATLIGARTADELSENVALYRTAVPADLWADLKEHGLLRADAPTPH